MNKIKRNKWVDYYGRPIKLPRTMQELADLVSSEIHSAKRHAEDHVLYLQGRPNRSTGKSYAFTPGIHDSVDVTVISNARQDIVKALADIGAANAKIAYSLMRALEGSK